MTPTEAASEPMTIPAIVALLGALTAFLAALGGKEVVVFILTRLGRSPYARRAEEVETEDKVAKYWEDRWANVVEETARLEAKIDAGEQIRKDLLATAEAVKKSADDERKRHRREIAVERREKGELIKRVKSLEDDNASLTTKVARLEAIITRAGLDPEA